MNIIPLFAFFTLLVCFVILTAYVFQSSFEEWSELGSSILFLGLLIYVSLCLRELDHLLKY